VLAKKAPGLAALEPQAEAAGKMEVGFAWHTIEIDGREITWHNGATGGMHTIVALDRQRRQGVVILGNTTRSVDLLGLDLAASNGPVKAVDSAGIPDVPTIAATLAGLWFLIIFASAAVRRKDRLHVAAGLLAGAAGLLLLLAHGPWMLVPAWAWGPLTGASVALAGYAVLRSASLPTWPGRRTMGDSLESPRRYAWRRALSVVSAVANLIVLGFVIWSL
jgi:hypothetical protein